MEKPKRIYRRFSVEEIDNGYILKFTNMATDQLLGRYAFTSLDSCLDAIRNTISRDN